MMFGSPVVAIVTLTLAFAFLYAGIKNENIVDVLTGKSAPGNVTGPNVNPIPGVLGNGAQGLATG